MTNSDRRLPAGCAGSWPRPDGARSAPAVWTAAILCLALVSGCGVPRVTFPAGTVTQSVQQICKDLYQIDVVSQIHGSTLGVLLYAEHLIDSTGDFDREFVQEALLNLSTSVTRVALSTDRPIDFVVVVLRGMEDENQIRIIRSVVDIKKAQTDALSVEESMNRTVQELGKFKFDPMKADNVPLADVTLETFLTKQITQRVRLLAPPKTSGPPLLPSEIVEGRFLESPKRAFEFSILTFEASEPENNVIKVLKQTDEVLKGYRYEDFDEIVMKDLLGRKVLTVTHEDYFRFQKKELTEADILDIGFKDDLTSTDRFKNALEVFEYPIQ